MVIRCCLQDCKSEKYPGCKITFHCFPKNETLRREWIEAVGFSHKLKNKMVCSLHFKNDDFMKRGSLKILKPNVVPTCRLTKNKSDITDISRCECCLERDALRSMWREYQEDGLSEVYGAMLVDCFALRWSRPADPDVSTEQICEACVRRLRDAVSFKAEVLASQQLLSGQLDIVEADKLKHEREDAELPEDREQYDRLEDTCNVANDDIEGLDASSEDLDEDKVGDGVKIKTETMQLSVCAELDPTSDEEKCSRIKTSTSLRKRRECQVERVEAPGEVTSRLAAAKRCKVSRKALSRTLKNNTKIIEEKNVDGEQVKNGIMFVEMDATEEYEQFEADTIHWVKEEDSGKEMRSRAREKISPEKKTSENKLAEMKKQANNIAVILEHTNATPIRRHGGIGYGCCFCTAEYPDPADLKQHTIKSHDVKTKRSFAKGKRPSAYLVKLDITGLKCNLCMSNVDSLDELYDHLTDVHKKLLYRNAKKYIVPFKFESEELRCVFCEFICNSFKGLLEHMSVHYRNHICEICDAGFLTKNNLFNHHGRHKKGTFKCDYCTKVFDTSSKKAGHQRLVHSSTNGVNRCGYCGEMFGTYRRKEKHLMTVHGVTLKKLKCKACEKSFETQTALRIHTKRDHLIERRFKCSVCEKRCFTNVQLMQHMLKHTGVKKFQCTVCMKAYGRKSTLREHMRIHENDRRFKCELCGMAFVQKCSWRGHMLSKHGQQV